MDDKELPPGEVQLQFASEEDMVNELQRRGLFAVITSVRVSPKDNTMESRSLYWRGSTIMAIGLVEVTKRRLYEYIHAHAVPDDGEGHDEEKDT